MFQKSALSLPHILWKLVGRNFIVRHEINRGRHIRKQGPAQGRRICQSWREGQPLGRNFHVFCAFKVDRFDSFAH